MRQADPGPAAPPRAGIDGPRAVDVVRDGAVESVHRAVVAVAEPDGRLLVGAGHVDEPVYARSAIKPAQAAACLDVLAGDDADAGASPEVTIELGAAAVAIGAASHGGGDDHQIEAARLLALAGLDEAALRCPPAAPLEVAGGERTPLAHNCSGKHALMLLATTVAGADPAAYLDPAARVQHAVRRRVAELAGEAPAGPGVDGCGAPAWRLSLQGLATLAARVATATAAAAAPPRRAGAGDPALAQVAAAMRARPDLVGGTGAVDTALMRASPNVVAKRGAEGVLMAGVGEVDGGGGLGVAVKVVDGASRAAGPLVAGLLEAAGVAVPADVGRPPVLGGGAAHGELRLTDEVAGVVSAVAER